MVLNRSIRFFVVEKITFIYILITTIIIIYLKPELSIAYNLLSYRLLFILLIVLLAYLNSIWNIWPIRLSRYAFLGGLLMYWYPETYDINKVLINYDYVLAQLEQSIFGFQPALEFSKVCHQHWLSELLNMGYFAYYPLIIGTCLFFFFTNRKYFEFFFFSVLFSFFCYYLFFILFPTVGPQYYYPAIGLNNVEAGIFPQVGHYFKENHTLLSGASNSGFFYNMVESTQQVGERPTAAFPSSHVGISTLIMILIFNNRRYLLLMFVAPLYLSLVVATVYIQAHYVIDVIAGLVTASLLCYLSNVVFNIFTRNYYGVLELSPLFHKHLHKP